LALGWALAPVRIVSKNNTISVHGFPLIEDFSEEEIQYDDRSRRIIRKDGVTKIRDTLVSKDFSNEDYDDQCDAQQLYK